jgi:hypothetical protein
MNWGGLVNRTELQQLAINRVDDAQALLDAKRWSAAYYIAGYAAECALKACILARVERTGVIFDEREFPKRCWTHNVLDLVEAADIRADLDSGSAANPKFGANWQTVKDWNETSRYKQHGEIEARKLLEAITHDPDGVLKWIRNHW